MAEPQGPRPDGSAPAGPLPVEDIETRAARLGITLDRVLEELGSIAFTKITRIVSWDAQKLTMTASGELGETDKAAVAEIVASAKDQKIYRVKMFDKTPALALLIRWFWMLEKIKRGANENEQVDDDGEDPHEFLIREFDRIAAEKGKRSGDPNAQR